MKKLIIAAVSVIVGAAGVFAAEPIKGNAKKPTANPSSTTSVSSSETSGKWTVDDAQKFLSSLSAKGAANLPKYADKQSPLKKVVDSVDDMTDGADIRTKMTNISKALTIFGHLTQRYSNAAAQGNKYDEEILYLSCASMKISSLSITSLEKLKETFNENDPNYHQKLAGLERMKAGAAQQLIVMCMLIEAKDNISDQLRLVACKYLVDYGAVIVENTPGSFKPGVKIKYQQLLESEKNPEIKSRLAKFLGYFGS